MKFITNDVYKDKVDNMYISDKLCHSLLTSLFSYGIKRQIKFVFLLFTIWSWVFLFLYCFVFLLLFFFFFCFVLFCFCFCFFFFVSFFRGGGCFVVVVFVCLFFVFCYVFFSILVVSVLLTFFLF